MNLYVCQILNPMRDRFQNLAWICIIYINNKVNNLEKSKVLEQGLATLIKVKKKGWMIRQVNSQITGYKIKNKNKNMVI